MTLRLADIGVAVDRGGLGAGVAALLCEIAERVERLAAEGATDVIDLATLPLNPADRERLGEALGEGEVRATLDVDGVSRVRETGVPGVWWIEHRDTRGELIAELIEIALFPEILSAAAEDLGRGAAALRACIEAGGGDGVTEELP